MSNTIGVHKLGLLACVASIALVQPATAQAPDAEQSDRQDIVVTAQKSSQRLQDVAAAVSAITPQLLERANINRFSELDKISPSITIQRGNQPENSGVSIRGIGTSVFGVGVEPSVSILIDDVAVARQSQAFNDLVDIDRIEVLRGPQSTLFGKNASAGVISIYTKKPTETFTGIYSGMVTTDREYRGSLSLSGPINEQLGYRITGAISDYAGDVTNTVNGQRLNGIRSYALSGKLFWQPTSNLDFMLGGKYLRNNADCCVMVFVRGDPNATFLGNPANTFAALNPGVTPSFTNDKVALDTPVSYRNRTLDAALTGHYRFGDGFVLTSITSYDDWKQRVRVDADQSTYPSFSQGDNTSKSFTQELRINTPEKASLRAVAGLYYSDDSASQLFQRLLFSPSNYDAYNHRQSGSAYAQATWTIAKGLDLIGGGRIQRVHIRYRFNNLRLGQDLTGSTSDDVFLFKAGADYHLNDNLMIFGTFAKGYKSPGYDLSNLTAATAARGPVRPERSDDFEVGFRSSFLDRRVTLNVTAFNTRYRDFQALAIDPVLTATFNLANVGVVKTRGIEVEARATPVKGLELDASATYLDAKVASYPGAQCYFRQTVAQGCVGGVQDLSGQPLYNAPRWTMVAGANYNFDLGALPFQGFVSPQINYKSATRTTLQGGPGTTQSPYAIVNLNLGIRHDGPHGYQVSVFVNNLLDKKYGYFDAAGNASWGGLAVQSFNRPRDYDRYAGLRVSGSF
ncbi:MAG TPA: TonB-dependent receptor [Sphingobium sp.]|uniref:TonB-dependent receptor n=1 Tax=Sphingobium sp. TaxID=1912891 RepID=UPI002ED50AF2